MSHVFDASVVVAALVDDSVVGRWAESHLLDGLIAPHLMPAEVANVLRRLAFRDVISADSASLAHADLLNLRVELIPYHWVAERVWTLRPNLTSYDAWYVAVAELAGRDLVTLDQRLAGAPGPECRVVVPTGLADPA